uniref:Uncharacterized protein n=1 Tax=Moschus moschiferus TaxID=68415 RepID=A0A8C6DK77_MOSMO
MAARVEAVAKVAATEPKMEEESGAPGMPRSKCAAGLTGEGKQPALNEKRKEKNIKREAVAFSHMPIQLKDRAFITDIPFDVKWQSHKDLVKEKGGLACCDSWGRKESVMTERLN